MVVQDTPIFDKAFFDNLKTSFPRARLNDGYRDINDRIQTVKTFIEYLKTREVIENTPSQYIPTGIVDNIFNAGFQRDMKRNQRLNR